MIAGMATDPKKRPRGRPRKNKIKVGLSLPIPVRDAMVELAGLHLRDFSSEVTVALNEYIKKHRASPNSGVSDQD